MILQNEKCFHRLSTDRVRWWRNQYFMRKVFLQTDRRTTWFQYTPPPTLLRRGKIIEIQVFILHITYNVILHVHVKRSKQLYYYMATSPGHTSDKSRRLVCDYVLFAHQESFATLCNRQRLSICELFTTNWTTKARI